VEETWVGGPLRILLVDDEPDITASLKMGLERQGFQVDTFNDPKKALAEFKPNRYDMVFLDIRMPQMSGFELYRGLRASDQSVPIAFLTAFDVYQNEFQKMFPDMKVDRLLRKPISITELVAYVKSQKPPAKNVTP
jgi:DNA-binding response OmpR family regulator